jgi:hypothetical protein
MPPRKIKCSFSDCKSAAQRISGDCAFCNGHYCNNHRLLEDHKCQNLEDVSSTLGSLAPCSPEARAQDEPQWWLVGLSDVLSEDDSLADLCFRSPNNSARRRRLSKMPCSSTRSAPKSSEVCKAGRARKRPSPGSRHPRRRPAGRPDAFRTSLHRDDAPCDKKLTSPNARPLTGAALRRARKRQWRRRSAKVAIAD